MAKDKGKNVAFELTDQHIALLEPRYDEFRQLRRKGKETEKAALLQRLAVKLKGDFKLKVEGSIVKEVSDRDGSRHRMRSQYKQAVTAHLAENAKLRERKAKVDGKAVNGSLMFYKRNKEVVTEFMKLPANKGMNFPQAISRYFASDALTDEDRAEWEQKAKDHNLGLGPMEDKIE